MLKKLLKNKYIRGWFVLLNLLFKMIFTEWQQKWAFMLVVGIFSFYVIFNGNFWLDGQSFLSGFDFESSFKHYADAGYEFVKIRTWKKL